MHRPVWLAGVIVLGLMGVANGADSAARLEVGARVDPLTRYVQIRYRVPKDAPPTVSVRCRYQLKGETQWRVPAVDKYRSETALALLDVAPEPSRDDLGQVQEDLAAGLERTLVWNAGEQLGWGEQHSAVVRVTVLDGRKVLAEGQAPLSLDGRDVVTLSRQMLVPRHAAATQPTREPGWLWQQGGNLLDCNEGPAPLEPLSFQLGLRGEYAIFVNVPDDPPSHVELRLTGDFYNQRFPGGGLRERFWRIARLDGQSLIVYQPHVTIDRPAEIGNVYRARLKSIRFVPVSKSIAQQQARLDDLPHDKLVFSFYESYSWAFHQHVDRNTRLAEPMAAFAQAKIDVVDAQFGRLGMPPTYPSQVEAPLVGETIGDTLPGQETPTSPNVGRLARYTDPWGASSTFARTFGVEVSVNFGAGVAYPGTPLEGEFAKAHPQWFKDKTWPRYEIPEIRQHLLAMYREFLERGARRLTIDFTRYPFVANDAQSPTVFLSELRALANKYSAGGRVLITAAFPMHGIKGENGFYRPRDWIAKRLVDFIVPSEAGDNSSFADVREYLAMTSGTPVKCLPQVQGLLQGPLWPGQILARVKQLYDWGAPGIYIYQGDSRIVGTMSSGQVMENQRFIARLGSSEAVNAMFAGAKERDQEYSTEIYLFYFETYSGNRVKVWIEGGQPEEVQYFMDGKQVPGMTEPSYAIGLPGTANDYPVTGRPTTFEVRAKIRGRWLVRKHEWTVAPSYSY